MTISFNEVTTTFIFRHGLKAIKFCVFSYGVFFVGKFEKRDPHTKEIIGDAIKNLVIIYLYNYN